MKYIWSVLLWLSFLWLYFYHSIVFNSINFTKKYNIQINIKNDYFHYYFWVDDNPIYVFKKNLLDRYVLWSFEHKKSWLVFSNQQTVADLNYISDIQYAAEYKDVYNAKFLSNELNYITNLSPYWVSIYNFIQLILPISKTSDATWQEKIDNWNYVVKLWEKWVNFNCNKQKINKILNLKDDVFFRLAYNKKWEIYENIKNPCESYKLPEKIWFNYMYYLKDYKSAIKFYKIASFHDKTPYWIIWIVSVINSMAWEHEKAIYMLYERLTWLEKKMSNKNISDKEFEQTKDYYNLTLRRLEEEFNLYLISQASINWKDCNKKYDCLWEKWYVLSEINKLIVSCRKQRKLDLNSISNINWNTDNVIWQLKCMLLSLWTQKWYIQKTKLVSPLLKSDLYKYNYEKENWTAYKK